MTSNTQTDAEALKQQVSELSLQISQISAKLTHRSRSTSRSHPTRLRSSYNRDESTWICRYHRKFGSKAHNLTHKRFLVDTAAEVSVLPSSSKERHSTTALALCAANGSRILTYGNRSMTPNLGLRRTFRWVLLIADVQTAILGADFPTHFGLLVDVKGRRLVDQATNLSVAGIQCCSKPPAIKVLTPDLAGPYAALIKEYKYLFQPLAFPTQLHHEVTHKILTTGNPVSSRPRRLAPVKLTTAKPWPNSDSTQTRPLERDRRAGQVYRCPADTDVQTEQIPSRSQSCMSNLTEVGIKWIEQRKDTSQS
ncbi:hypothetical protein T265_11227 [Opisthorchis viverrini]|uniref:Peptidase A2 domain-containing protein n=1 Tax=Opisthorchis viverrini TaxID=6198 RepID=A0A074Z3U2_OPIVI|nr:hypothetical protein T265_11227 [Opisthorchis viverrini]KER20162.1 hypothetical protein T265_11227 [Opisthorchis viverrini]